MEAHSLGPVRYTYVPETGLAEVILDRPEELNSISDDLRSAVVTAFNRVEEYDEQGDGVSVRAVTVRGAGDEAFCAGGDIESVSTKHSFEFRTQEPYDTIESFGAPVVAAIDGYCLGGGMELALACDFRLASEDALFGQPEVDIGLIPGSGGTQRLTRLLGPSKTKELCMTGRKLPAAEAHEIGIVDHVYDSEAFEEGVHSFLETIRDKPPLAVRGIKDAVNRAQEVSLREGRLYERRIFQALLETEDFETGVEAFGDESEPDWQGK